MIIHYDHDMKLLQTIHQQIVDVKSSSQVAMVLVGNKCDMEMDREVSKEQVGSFLIPPLLKFEFLKNL